MSDSNRNGATSTYPKEANHADGGGAAGDDLKAQAEQAKAQFAEALGHAASALNGKINPLHAARKHPLVAIGSAAAAGFVAAMVAIPSKEQQELRRLERLHRAMHPEPVAAEHQTNGKQKPGPEKASLLAVILKELIAVLRPILMTAITSSMKAAATPPEASSPGSPTAAGAAAGVASGAENPDGAVVDPARPDISGTL